MNFFNEKDNDVSNNVSYYVTEEAKGFWITWGC